MTFLDKFSGFSLVDVAAVVAFLCLWVSTNYIIENAPKHRQSMTQIMATFRREWMRVMVTRDPRIVDTAVLGFLRQGSTFFASTTLLVIGGGLAMLGNTEQLSGVAEDFALQNTSPFVWEVKILMVIAIISNAFLKFVWAHRLFGYCAVLMASVPNKEDDPNAYPMAAKTAEICTTASRSFNRGLRSLYFALAGLAWLIDPIALLAAATLSFLVLYRREFKSRSRDILLADMAKKPIEGLT